MFFGRELVNDAILLISCFDISIVLGQLILYEWNSLLVGLPAIYPFLILEEFRTLNFLLWKYIYIYMY